MAEVSIVIPAYNEAGSIRGTIEAAGKAFDGTPHAREIIVVDDGSQDATAQEAAAAGARVIRHAQNLGYGFSIRTGTLNARYALIAITDADGTYPVHELPSMVSEVEERGLDMLVGARRGTHYHGSLLKRGSRVLFKFLSEFTVGRKIPDINSGLRVFRRAMILRFWKVLCGGFSFTTTITMIAMITGHTVDYRPVDYYPRTGSSKVHYFRDTLRTAQILVMTMLLFNPIKVFLLGVLLFALLGGAAVAAVLLVPPLADVVLIASLFAVAAGILGGFGLLAEQRRALAPPGFDEFAHDGKERR